MLADEFTADPILIRTALDTPDPDQHDQVSRLNVELQKVITRIRAIAWSVPFPSPPTLLRTATGSSRGPCHHCECEQVWL
ncbi:hypothetical protein J3R82DRAFT_3624 [Butyriboletus roseoflavus]|nr:hypothetical protein J3R82DRAFT_3624 [Butyriboletus roseoflavus]